MLRYKPAFREKALYIERYLELTESMLNYSKNKNNEPLFRIPIDQIEQAYWVDI